MTNLYGKVHFHIYNQSVFDFDFMSIKNEIHGKEILILGNPPWVTNSKLGLMESNNLPQKSNYKKSKGLDAITGKGNFDIAEYITNQLLHFVDTENAVLAFLLKNSVIRNIIHEQRKSKLHISNIRQLNIEADQEFNASVSASLFYCKIGMPAMDICDVYNFYNQRLLYSYGWISDKFVANVEKYEQIKDIDGVSPLTWWSGIKHDCAKIMELTKENDKYINGLGEVVDIEDEIIFPLVKSSDIKGDTISSTRKYIILTQHSPSEDTMYLQFKYPKAYQYLLLHADLLDGRKSIIYKNRPRFCIFGVGDYTFRKYKIVVSGLYKNAQFAIVSLIDNKIALTDDTCYILGFDNYEEAKQTLDVLNGEQVQSFIQSVYFVDDKRVITKDLLMRINLIQALKLSCKPITMQYYNYLYKRQVPMQSSLF